MDGSDANQLISSLQRRVKANLPIFDWGDISHYYRHEFELPAHRLSILVVRMSNLRAAISEEAVTDCSTIVLSLLSIDAGLSEWVALLPKRWAFTTIGTMTESDETYGNQQHLYGDVWIASVWNSYRCVRILCNAEITTHIKRLPSPYDQSIEVDFSAQARVSSNLLIQLASDICGSISFHLGRPTIQDGRLSFQCRALFGFYLLWPLFIAGDASGVPDPLRVWVVRVLDGIGYSLGIAQASSLAQMLRTSSASTQNNSQNASQAGSPESRDSVDDAPEEVYVPQRTKAYMKFATLTRNQAVEL